MSIAENTDNISPSNSSYACSLSFINSDTRVKIPIYFLQDAKLFKEPLTTCCKVFFCYNLLQNLLQYSFKSAITISGDTSVKSSHMIFPFYLICTVLGLSY